MSSSRTAHSSLSRSHSAAKGIEQGFGKNTPLVNFGRFANRQQQVAACLAQGLTYKEIGRKLGIAVGTVASYTRSLKAQLNTSSCSSIAAIYAKYRLKRTDLLAIGALTINVDLTNVYNYLMRSNKRQFTPGRQKILELICQNLTNARIAGQLSVSENTVKTHLKRLYADLGVRNRNEAAIWGRANGYGGDKPPLLAFTRLLSIEIDVVELVSQGKTNAEIDRALRFSKPTARVILARVARRLGESNRKKIAESYIQFKLDHPKD